MPNDLPVTGSSSGSEQSTTAPSGTTRGILDATAIPKIAISELEEEDITLGFLDSLDNLIPGTSRLQPGHAREILKEIKSNPLHKIFVATTSAPTQEERPPFASRQVVGTTTLLIEPKFILGGSRVGHIEDVSVRTGFEKLGIGAKLVSHAVLQAEKAGCIKIVLDCSDSTMPFYEKLGFSYQDNCMKKSPSSGAAQST